jgi:hypothetical protein
LGKQQSRNRNLTLSLFPVEAEREKARREGTHRINKRTSKLVRPVSLGLGKVVSPRWTAITQRLQNQRVDAAPTVTETRNCANACDRMARHVLFAFVMTFVTSRILVFLIMAREIPNMFFFLNGTHVHHLNYGIFLMSAVCGYALFRRPEGRAADITALFYGVALGLTFDEFGMWLHLGGSYWQRVSVDAVIIVAAVFALLAYMRSLEQLESHHIWMFSVLIIALIGFGVVIFVARNHLGNLLGPTLHDLESSSSP